MDESNHNRNMEIFEKHKSGMSYRSIGREYGMSATRVMQIVRRIERMADMENSALMALLVDAAEMVGSDYKVAVRAYNILVRNGCDDVGNLAELDVSEVIGWRNVGFVIEDVIATAHAMAKEVD